MKRAQNPTGMTGDFKRMTLAGVNTPTNGNQWGHDHHDLRGDAERRLRTGEHPPRGDITRLDEHDKEARPTTTNPRTSDVPESPPAKDSGNQGSMDVHGHRTTPRDGKGRGGHLATRACTAVHDAMTNLQDKFATLNPSATLTQLPTTASTTPTHTTHPAPHAASYSCHVGTGPSENPSQTQLNTKGGRPDQARTRPTTAQESKDPEHTILDDILGTAETEQDLDDFEEFTEASGGTGGNTDLDDSKGGDGGNSGGRGGKGGEGGDGGEVQRLESNQIEVKDKRGKDDKGGKGGKGGTGDKGAGNTGGNGGRSSGSSSGSSAEVLVAGAQVGATAQDKSGATTKEQRQGRRRPSRPDKNKRRRSDQQAGRAPPPKKQRQRSAAEVAKRAADRAKRYPTAGKQ